MLKIYVKTSDLLSRLRSDKDGVVSFEYIVVAACVVGAVALAFGSDTSSGIGLALKNGIALVVGKLPT
jgi:hypothetical protein